MKFKIITLMNLLALVFVSSSYINHKESQGNKYVPINHSVVFKYATDSQSYDAHCNKCHDCKAHNTTTTDTLSTSIKDLMKSHPLQLEESKNRTTNKIENVDLDFNLYPDTFKII